MKLIPKFQNASSQFKHIGESYEDEIKRKEAEFFRDNEISGRFVASGPMTTIHPTNGGNISGAPIDTNLLYAIALSAERVGLSFEEALGLAIKESTLGNPTTDKSILKIVNLNDPYWLLVKADLDKYGTLYNRHNPYEDYDLLDVFNWQTANDARNPYYSEIQYIDNLWEKQGEPKNFPWEDYYKQGLRTADRKMQNYQKDNSPMLDLILTYYKNNKNNYNSNLKNYSELVMKLGKRAMQSPEIQEWYNNYLEFKRPNILRTLVVKP